ncbi:tetratricopeptide repeat protein [Spirillospora sp. NPDC050679]
MGDQPDKPEFATIEEFRAELQRLKLGVGLSYREISAATGIPKSTVGDYFGRRPVLPKLNSGNLRLILEALRADPDEREALDRSLFYLKRKALPAPYDDRVEFGSAVGSVEPSIRPPTGRMRGEPPLRGRERLLRSLHRRIGQRFHNGGGPSVHVLHGLGGSGKSSIALALAMAQSRHVSVWWITATNAHLVNQGMQSVRDSLGGSRDQLRLPASPDQLWPLLKSRRRPWMLVFDDVENPVAAFCAEGGALRDGTGWLQEAEGSPGVVIVTTRDGRSSTWGEDIPWLQLHRVDPLLPADGTELLVEFAGPAAGPKSDAEALAARLGHVPQALRVVGKFLRKTAGMPEALASRATIRDYSDCLAALDSRGHDGLFAEVPEQPSAREVTGWAWERSLALLDSTDRPEARALLQMLSCLGTAPIPGGLLLDVEILRRTPPFAGLTGNRLWSALTALDELGLMEKFDDEDDVLLTLHPLIRDICRREGGVTGTDHLARCTDLLGAVTASLDPRDPAAWRAWSRLADHCLELLEASGSGLSPETVLPVSQAVQYLRASGLLWRARSMSEAALSIVGGLLGPDHPIVLGMEHDHHRVLYHLGHYETAVAGFARVADVRRRVLGAHHRDTLASRHYEAMVLRDLGRIDEAEQRFLTNLEARLRALGPDDRDTWTSMNNVADMHRLRGRFDEAEPLLAEVRKRRTESIGPESPSTLSTLYLLALLRRDRGDIAAAESELRQLATLTRKVLGDRHPRTLEARHALADVMLAQGRTSEGRALIAGVLADRRRSLGDAHPLTIATDRALRRCAET